MSKRSSAVALAAAACLLLPRGAGAIGNDWMSAAEILRELTGIRLAGVYPSKVTWVEMINADGTSDYWEGNERRPGRWTVSTDLFCFVYAIPEQGGCFRIVKRSDNCYELYTASIGSLAPSVPPPASKMSWNGRMWKEAAPHTCDEKPIS